MKHGPTPPERLLEDLWPYFDLAPEERSRMIHSVCETAMRQWRALPDEERLRWPPEPGPEGEAILRRWAREFRERKHAAPGR